MATSVSARSLALPPRIGGLADLACNLWWSWHPPAEALFRLLDPMLWEALDRNPGALLRRLPIGRLEAAAVDPTYLKIYDDVMARFATLGADDAAATWVERHEPELARLPVAYFSAEFGLHPALPIYSGGLGVLAGDHAKAASDLGLPLSGVSLLYR